MYNSSYIRIRICILHKNQIFTFHWFIQISLVRYYIYNRSGGFPDFVMSRKNKSHLKGSKNVTANNMQNSKINIWYISFLVGRKHYFKSTYVYLIGPYKIFRKGNSNLILKPLLWSNCNQMVQNNTIL